MASEERDPEGGVARRAEMAGLLALLVSALVAALLDRSPPLEPLAALVMEWTPVPIANWLLEALGAVGKPLALYGAAALTLAVTGLLGRLAASRRMGRRGLWVAVALSLALAAPLMRPGAWPGLATLVGGFWLALWLLGRAPRTAPSVILSPMDSSRRRALLLAGLNAGALAAVSLLPVAASVLRLQVVGRVSRPPLFPYQPPEPRRPGFALAGLTPEVTPLPAFYVMSKNVADPVLSAATWSLTVHGAVRRNLSLTLDDLAELPRTDQHVTMQCVSNPVGGPLWSATYFSGVLLADLLARAEPAPAASWVSFEAPDGHREQLPLDLARNSLMLVAYGMAGDWLRPEHGYPARLLAPGLYGFRSVKWLTRIEILDAPRPGHWEERGWSAAEIHTTARVDLVQRSQGETIAAGVAFAGARGVSAVEVRVDGGPWRPAELHAPPPGPVMWVQWRASLDLPAGREVRVEAHAFDGAGQPQDEAVRGQFPNGATGLHGLSVRL